MSGRFILSLDCEGKWGVADALTGSHRRDLSARSLSSAYRSIIDVLDEFQIEATFAFAGAFSQSSRHFCRIRPEIERMAEHAVDYLAPALQDIDASSGDGWHGSDFVEMVCASSLGHEIALHGVTHVPWTLMDPAFAEAEMRLFEQLDGPVRRSRTFVYPRNLVAHSAILADHGFVGFRTARKTRPRIASLLSEFNILEPAQQAKRGDRIVRIPSGFFLNWRNGARRLVPPSVTRLRLRRLLDHAAESGRVVHYWLHPENIATAPSTLALVRILAAEVARMRDARRCEVMTQLAYCRWVESLT